MQQMISKMEAKLKASGGNSTVNRDSVIDL